MTYVSKHSPALPLRALLAAPLLLALAGCFSLGGDRTELAVYAPRIVLEADAGWPSIQRTLAIGEPTASSVLDSNRIAVRPDPQRLQVYAGAVWSDSAPSLVQSALVSAFDQAGRFTAVGRTTSDAPSDLLLQLDLLQFEAVYADSAGNPTAVVALKATLIDQRERRVLGSRVVTAEVPADGTQLPEVVPAFEAALVESARQLVPWVLKQAAQPIEK